MATLFNGHGPAAYGIPADDLPVTPSDSEDLPKVAMAIYCAGAGTIVYDTLEGESRERDVPDHFTFFCAVKRVRATGTTATGIVASVF
ncbi:hypothetical protein SAMN05444336_101253 [Albimonas donghaensis]|uniref:Uncharacterized protein n=1 Tax=Albimonas donghaensis TaxID=356660 RepID=A0A1H2R8A5_9RHOB|nr:hypothetical protein [Albimonas donghaensis]SDW15074.1 hypothetical protein SAMN05444336_101253 [Albimonas donghaensis]